MAFRWKLFLAYVCLLVSILSVYDVWTEQWLRTTYLEGVHQQLQREAELIGSLLSSDAPDIDQQVDASAREGRRLTVVDQSGRVIADSAFSGDDLVALDNHGRRPEVLEAKVHGVGSRLRFSRSVGEELLYVAVRTGDGRAYVRVSTSVAGLEQATSDLRWTLVARTILLIAIGLPLAFLLARHFSRTLSHLEGAARRIAAGDFDVPIQAGGRDDVSRLGRTMQSMAHQLRDHVQTIESDRSHVQAVLNSMTEGVMATDSGNRIVESNPALLEILGLRSDPFGKPLLEVLRNIEIQQQIEGVRGTGLGAEKEVQVAGLRLVARSAPLRAGSEVTGVVTVFTNVTELRRLERARRDFIGNVSHELRTPLTSISGYTETLLDGRTLGDVETGYLGKIEHNAAQLQEIVDALLELARIEHREESPARRKIDFSHLMGEIQRDFAAELADRPIQIEFPKNVPSETIRVPEAYLKRVLLNLLDNALKYTSEGHIQVGFEKNDEEYLFSVKDTGAGIPDQDLDRVFERFYRGAQAVSGRISGSGMGLAITRHMVEVMGGRIWLESQLKKGTTVYFTIPRKISDGHA